MYVDFHNPDGLGRSCAVSRHDGFTGRVAIHPNQVAIINKTYSPDESEVILAQRIVAAFANGAGAVAIDGKMYDIPHLKAAHRLLASVEVNHG
ncbi:(3S)-malyl-CoA thioesterase [compost metagenome]